MVLAWFCRKNEDLASSCLLRLFANWKKEEVQHKYWFFGVWHFFRHQKSIQLLTARALLPFYRRKYLHVAYSLCERVHDGHRSIFVVVHAGPSPAEGLGGLTPLYFKDQFTLSQPGWAHYPHSLVLAPLVLLAPSDFQNLQRPWHVVCVQRRPPPGNLNGLKNMALAI